MKKIALHYVLIPVMLMMLSLACFMPGAAAMMMTPYLQAVTTRPGSGRWYLPIGRSA